MVYCPNQLMLMLIWRFLKGQFWNLLFLLYINDITEVMNGDCSIKLFADDMLIYATEYSRQKINNRLNEQMVRVVEQE